MEILDLNNISIIFNNDLQDNVQKIIEKYGNELIIKSGDDFLPTKIINQTYPYNPDISFISFMYSLPRTTFLYPFKIDFFDYEDLTKNNVAYIANIHRTNKLTGTRIMEILLEFLRIINTEKVRIHDGAQIDCYNQPIDLSFFKLIEKGRTFYQKFGFRFRINKGDYQEIEFGNEQNIDKALNDLLDQFHKIKNKYLAQAYQEIMDILNDVIKKQDYSNVKIYLQHKIEPYLLEQDIVRNKCLNTIQELDFILSKVLLTRHEYFYQLLIDLFYHDCMDYVRIEDYIISNQIYGIVYNDRNVFLKHNYIFTYLRSIRNTSLELQF